MHDCKIKTENSYKFLKRITVLKEIIGVYLTKLHEFLYFNAAGHNMLLAHAKAWHTYDKEFRKTQQGRVSIVVNAQWFEPKTDTEEHIKAADRGMQWFLGWMAHPVFVNGDYPQVMKTRIMEKSKAWGLSSRFVILIQ